MKIFAVIVIFILSFINHFIYDIYSNTLFSIFFPVNESIFEHMKIIFTSILIYSIIELYLLRKQNIKFNNFLFNIFATGFLGIIVYLLIYIPLFLYFDTNLFVDITLLFIVYIITQIISYYILSSKNYKFLNMFSLFFIIVVYIIFGYLTYKPPHNFLFFDNANKIYGIIK